MRRPPAQHKIVPCNICGEPFEQATPQNTTCKKPECRYKAMRARKRLQAKRMRERQGIKPRPPKPPKPVSQQKSAPTPVVIGPSFPCPFVDHLNEKDHFEPRMSTLNSDFPDFTHAQNDPFGRYGDYEHHAVKVNKPQQERIAA